MRPVTPASCGVFLKLPVPLPVYAGGHGGLVLPLPGDWPFSRHGSLRRRLAAAASGHGPIQPAALESRPERMASRPAPGRRGPASGRKLCSASSASDSLLKAAAEGFKLRCECASATLRLASASAVDIAPPPTLRQRAT